MSRITETDSKFKDTIAGSLHGVLRAAGVAMPPGPQLERIRDIAIEMAEAIEFQAEKKSVEVVKKLQSAVKTAFVAMEADITKIREENARLHVENRMLSVKLDNLGEDVASLANTFYVTQGQTEEADNEDSTIRSD
jgi:hypothetical protein